MRMLLASIMLLHGLAHGVGFAGAWGLSKDIPYKTTIASGHIDVGGVGMRLIGVLWLVAAAAFVMTAMAALANHPVWITFAFVTTMFSLGLCLVELPQTRIGLNLNAFILFALLAAWQMGRLG